MRVMPPCLISSAEVASAPRWITVSRTNPVGGRVSSAVLPMRLMKRS